MKIKSYLFCKSFFLSFVIFGIIAGLILTSFYVKVNEVDPVNKESNIILGVVDNNKLVSMGVINFNPDNRTVTFLPIPDNTLLSKNNSILQDSYNPNNTKDLKNSVEDLIGAKINRYLFVSTDAIAVLTNQMLAQENTQLLCQILYKFNYGGEEYSSYCTIDSGEVAKAMFMADSYEDLKSSSGTTV